MALFNFGRNKEVKSESALGDVEKFITDSDKLVSNLKELRQRVSPAIKIYSTIVNGSQEENIKRFINMISDLLNQNKNILTENYFVAFEKDDKVKLHTFHENYVKIVLLLRDIFNAQNNLEKVKLLNDDNEVAFDNIIGIIKSTVLDVRERRSLIKKEKRSSDDSKIIAKKNPEVVEFPINKRYYELNLKDISEKIDYLINVSRSSVPMSLNMVRELDEMVKQGISVLMKEKDNKNISTEDIMNIRLFFENCKNIVNNFKSSSDLRERMKNIEQLQKVNLMIRSKIENNKAA